MLSNGSKRMDNRTINDFMEQELAFQIHEGEIDIVFERPSMYMSIVRANTFNIIYTNSLLYVCSISLTLSIDLLQLQILAVVIEFP